MHADPPVMKSFHMSPSQKQNLEVFYMNIRRCVCTQTHRSACTEFSNLRSYFIVAF